MVFAQMQGYCSAGSRCRVFWCFGVIGPTEEADWLANGADGQVGGVSEWKVQILRSEQDIPTSTLPTAQCATKHPVCTGWPTQYPESRNVRRLLRSFPGIVISVFR